MTPARNCAFIKGPAGRLAVFGRARGGAAAIEFALVVVPFFALLFAIIETALVFLAGQVFETAVADAARKVMTGQAQTRADPTDPTKIKPMTASEFKTEICNGLKAMFDCEGGVTIDVQSAATFGDLDLSAPKDADGNFDPGQTGYDIGQAGSIVMVRAFYQWPIFVDTMGLDLSDQPNGTRLLVGTAAFRNEPFGS